MHERKVVIVESGNGKYGQFINTGTRVFGADEPEALGGMNTGPDPFELLLSGLGACTAMTIRMYADRKGMSLERVSVHLSHGQRASQASGLGDRFERIIKLEGALSLEDREKLLQIAESCPVSQTLQRSSVISSSLEPNA